MKNLKNLLLLLILPILLSCQTTEWYKIQDPYEITKIIEVENPGQYCIGKPVDVLGCTNWLRVTKTAQIYIEKRLEPKNKECVKSHEIKHANGWDHPHRQGFYILCGDGTFQEFKGLNNG